MRKKVFVDTDIIYDVLANREPHYLPAAQLLTLADEEKITLTVSALSFANIHYLVSKQLSGDKAKQVLRTFRVLVHIAPINDKIIDLALNSAFTDFEDAIQYCCALESGCQVLLTRNLKDYKHARIPVMTAQDYINL
jgi:predicted nucleic acid-binding protein